MKNDKSPKIDRMLIDVVEYAFVEWLVRRKIYLAFRANYDRRPTSTRSFRDCLREHIRYLFSKSKFGPTSLISSAFLFTSTSEGCEFWLKHSEAWSRFYTSLFKKF